MMMRCDIIKGKKSLKITTWIHRVQDIINLWPIYIGHLLSVRYIGESPKDTALFENT